MKHIQQRGSKDCSVASCAMVAGSEYERILALIRDHDTLRYVAKAGASTEDIVWMTEKATGRAWEPMPIQGRITVRDYLGDRSKAPTEDCMISCMRWWPNGHVVAYEASRGMIHDPLSKSPESPDEARVADDFVAFIYLEEGQGRYG